MLLKNRKVFIGFMLILTSVFSISCSENKLKLNAEDLENCAKKSTLKLMKIIH